MLKCEGCEIHHLNFKLKLFSRNVHMAYLREKKIHTIILTIFSGCQERERFKIIG